MSERYARVYTLPQGLYATGAPIVIAAGALLYDKRTDKIIAQIKFQNISQRVVRAIEVSVQAFDIMGNELAGVDNYQFLDFAATRNEYFGHKRAIPLPENASRSFQICVNVVIFSDGSKWTKPSGVKWDALPIQRNLCDIWENEKIVEQYQRETAEFAKFELFDFADLWFCACGTINHHEEDECYDCHMKKDLFTSAMNFQTLHEHYKTHERKLAREKRLRIKRRRRNAIIASVLVICSLSAIFMKPVIIPFVKYTSAAYAVKKGDYQEAITIYESLGDYKDSPVQAKSATYHFAKKLASNGEYLEALSLFKSIPHYSDSANMILEVNYQMAQVFIKEGKYKEALSALNSSNYYGDSKALIDEIYTYIKESYFANAKVGDSVFLGVYEQNNNEADGKEPIEWVVIAEEDDMYLLLSKYCIDHRDDSLKSWFSTPCRIWLNGHFMKNAFNDAEQESIEQVLLSNGNSQKTLDKVFLMSADEFNQYLVNQPDIIRTAPATKYAQTKGIQIADNGNAYWALRAYSTSPKTIYAVNHEGSLLSAAETNIPDGLAIRPAMWVKVN